MFRTKVNPNLHINKRSERLYFERRAHDDEHITVLEVLLQTALEAVGEALAEEHDVGLHHARALRTYRDLVREYTL